jgi:hypothetical protein
LIPSEPGGLIGEHEGHFMSPNEDPGIEDDPGNWNSWATILYAVPTLSRRAQMGIFQRKEI